MSNQKGYSPLILLGIMLLITAGSLYYIVSSLFKTTTLPFPNPSVLTKGPTPTADKHTIKQSDKLNNILEQRLDEAFANLINLTNQRKFSEIYDKYMGSGLLLDENKDNYISSINAYFSKFQIKKIIAKVNGITVSAPFGFVNRTLWYCYDQDCNSKLVDNAVVRWSFLDDKWSTTQESPICIREAPYLISATSYLNKNLYAIPQYSVELISNVSCDIFPIYWQFNQNFTDYQSLSKMVQPVDIDEINRSIDILRRGMSKYPPKIINDNLKQVYVVKKLTFWNIPYGGTNSISRIYIKNQGVVNGFTDQVVEGVFHAEFSSILLRNHPSLLDANKWGSINPVNFSYGTGGSDEIKNGQASEIFSEKDENEGFINEYARSSMENDFNEFAQFIFAGDDRFWRIVDNYPKIKNKLDLIIGFYHSLDPMFSENYFRSLKK